MINNYTIPFNRPHVVKDTLATLQQVLESGELTAGHYVAQCEAWLRNALQASHVFLTPSCTDALEMAMLLLDIRPGDEVIMPSYTFPSTANAVVLRGGVPVFVDIRADTMNIDETLIEPAITPRTRAVIAVHYAGVACEMNAILQIEKRHKIVVVEDAAQALTSTYYGRPLGTLGAIGTFSFHQTKNFTSGEGGAIVINESHLVERSELLRHKGVNRTAFLSGKSPYYTWMDTGSSWMMGELPAAYLYSNLCSATAINHHRMALWNFYFTRLQPLAEKGLCTLPRIPEGCSHNAHLFYLRFADKTMRDHCISFLAENKIMAVFHYIPLHSSPAGKKWGRFHGEDHNTTTQSERLLRLPLFYDLSMDEAGQVVDAIFRFFSQS